jgi:predicted enzyme related to lactoylglutathione lyase
VKTTADVRISKIAMVIVYSKDPMGSLPFYRDLLGMTVKEASPQWVELDGGGVSLAIHEHPKMPANRDEAAPWVVFQVDDIRGTYEALKAKGAKFLGEPKQVCGDDTMVGLSADLLDPDGNRLSLFAMVPAGK